MMTYCPYDDNLYGKETASQLKLISLIVTVSGYETLPCRIYAWYTYVFLAKICLFGQKKKNSKRKVYVSKNDKPSYRT